MRISIDEILQTRAKTHGDFEENSKLAQKLKRLVRKKQKGKDIPDFIKEGLDMILHKISRASCGDAFEIDHYRDIAGYATCIVKELQRLEYANR